jgi:hypothetical protein
MTSPLTVPPCRWYTVYRRKGITAFLRFVPDVVKITAIIWKRGQLFFYGKNNEKNQHCKNDEKNHFHKITSNLLIKISWK